MRIQFPGGRLLDQVVTSGTFTIDGESFAVDNNIWIPGDERECLIVDAAHSAEPILAAVDHRHVKAIVCTHGHNDHINVATALSAASGAPIWIHPDDAMLWSAVYPNESPSRHLVDGERIEVGPWSLEVLHTPGHSPGGCCLHDAAAGVVFSGDTLFKGGPGATGRSFSDRDLIEQSIRQRLFVLAESTVVYTGHGDPTTIGEELVSLPD